MTLLCPWVFQANWKNHFHGCYQSSVSNSFPTQEHARPPWLPTIMKRNLLVCLRHSRTQTSLVSSEFIDLLTEARDWPLRSVSRLMAATKQIWRISHKKLIGQLRTRLNVERSLIFSNLNDPSIASSLQNNCQRNYVLIHSVSLWDVKLKEEDVN